MSIYEYDEEKHIAQEKKQAREEGIEFGIKSGIESGIESVNKLNSFLAEHGRTDDIIKAASNPAYQKQLMKELKIK